LGFLEDFPIEVSDFCVPVDFVILDMAGNTYIKSFLEGLSWALQTVKLIPKQEVVF